MSRSSISNLLIFIALLAQAANAQAVLSYFAGGVPKTSHIAAGVKGIETSVVPGAGIAFAPDGSLYFADRLDNLILKLAPDGKLTIAGGNGQTGFSGDGGKATAARLNNPEAIAVDNSGNIYFADVDNNRVRKIDANGIVTTVAGNGKSGFSGDGGQATQATLGFGTLFRYPDSALHPGSVRGGGIAVDNNGNLYIGDGANNRLRKVNPAGIISTVAGNGSPYKSAEEADGKIATQATLGEVYGVATDAAGNVYFGAGFGVFKLESGGVLSLRGSTHAFRLAVDSAGVIYSVEDALIQKTTPDKVTTNLSKSCGTQSCPLEPTLGEGTPLDQVQAYANGIARDANGVLYFADTYDERIFKVDPAGVLHTIAGTGTLNFFGDGEAAKSAGFSNPTAALVDRAGTVFIADAGNRRIRKIDTRGVVSTFAVFPLSYPLHLAWLRDGGIAVSFAGNLIQKVSQDGKISTIAGGGTLSPNGGPVPAANAYIYGAESLAVDSSGNLYFLDYEIAPNVGTHIRKIDTGGILTRLELPADVRLDFDTALTFDPDDSLWIATGATVWKRTALGRFSTYQAPKGTHIRGAVSDAARGVYFTALENNQILLGQVLKVSPDGVISEHAGLQLINDASAPIVGAPLDGAMDNDGNFFLPDQFFHTVLKGSPLKGPGLYTSGLLNAASFQFGSIAPDEFVSQFGLNLAAGNALPSAVPLPVTLGGLTVKIRDAQGVERAAALQLVSPGQVNFVVPTATANGKATITITTAGGQAASTPATVARVNPGFFAANASGKGVAAATAARYAADGTITPLEVFRCGAVAGSCVATPLDLGAASDQVFLTLYGTGIRYRTALSAVRLTIGGVAASPAYAGAQGTYEGLDQVNVPVPRTLAGRGQVDVVLVVDGVTANAVTIAVK